MMRLVCPNCDAKYEVPEDAIPDAGRDVQCANCSHAWFQMRARTASAPVVTKQPEPAAEPPASPPAAAEPEPAVAMPPVAVEVAAEAEIPPEPAVPSGKSKAAGKTAAPPAEPPPPEVEAPNAGPPEGEPIAVAADPEVKAPVPVPETPEPKPQVVIAETIPARGLDAWPEMAEDVDPAPAIAARAVDEGVLTILREEAEREAKARHAEAQALESQPDLGVDAAPAARKKGAGKKPVPEPEPVEAAKASARRDLLPDVEEINSTLRPSDLPEAEFVGEPEAIARDGRSAFRSGFLLVLSAAILGGAIYIASAWLANLIPALEGPLKAYVGLIDGVRLSLDSLMQSATRLISGEPG